MNPDIELLRAAVEHDLGEPALWPTAIGYPNSLALCIIDAVYVTGARHQGVEKIIERYRRFRGGQGGDAATDGAVELLASVRDAGGPQQWASDIGNRRPTSTSKKAPLRSVAMVMLAEKLLALGIGTTEQLRAATVDDVRANLAQATWCAVPGQRSGFTWGYLVMLAQDPGVTVDHTVAAYIARVVGDDSYLNAAELLSATAELTGWGISALHHALWRFEAARPRDLAG